MGVQYRLLGGARRPRFMTDPASSKSFYPCRWTCIPFHTQGRRELLKRRGCHGLPRRYLAALAPET
jgi:hypothetical protein